MPIVNAKYFADNYYKGTGTVHQYLLPGTPRAVDSKSAKAVLADIEMYIKRGGQQHKSMRPWHLCPNVFADTLDRKQSWWGWEFETGWASAKAQLDAVGWVWDNIDGCMFDGEGEGNHQVEITFMPDEVKKYKTGKSAAQKFMQWVDANPHMIYKGAGNDVGTHLNMSSPLMTRNNQAQLAAFLNRTLYCCRQRNGDRKKLFGRESIYAGFLCNSSNADKNLWLEFKGFRTTYKLEDFESYLKTASGFEKLCQFFYANPDAVGYTEKACINFYDVVFNDADIVIGDFTKVEPAEGAARLSTRMGGSPYAFGPFRAAPMAQ